jgi:AraC family transcriptional regulator
MDILKVSHKNGIEPSMDMLFSKEDSIFPGRFNTIQRYYAQHPWVAEDTGMMVYHYNDQKTERELP